jgi:hypothetical protein
MVLDCADEQEEMETDLAYGEERQPTWRVQEGDSR